MSKLNENDSENESPYQQIEIYLRMAEDEIASAARIANSYEDIDTDDSQILEETSNVHSDDGFLPNSSFHPNSSSDSIEERCLPRNLQKLYRSAKRHIHVNGKLSPQVYRERRLSHRKSFRNEAIKYDGRVGSILQDAKLQKWSQDILKDFQTLVQEEIKYLCADKSSDPSEIHSETYKKQQLNLPDEPSLCRGISKFNSPKEEMGSAQSSIKFMDMWPTEYSNYRTYTLPRRNQRSLSLTSQTYESTYYDDINEPCRLIKLTQHRISRSHSLDEGKDLNPWTLEKVMNVGKVQGTDDQCCTSTNKADSVTKFQNDILEEKRNNIVEQVQETDSSKTQILLKNISMNGNKKPLVAVAKNALSNNSSHSDGDLSYLNDSSKSSALTIEDLIYSNGAQLPWADQDVIAGATGIRNLVAGDQNSDDSVGIKEATKYSFLAKENMALHYHGKSEPDIPSYCVSSAKYTIPGLEIRHMHSSNTKETSNNLLHTPDMPVFNARSWEVLPPDEEVEIMENKPIPDGNSDNGIVRTRLRTQSRSLNSSLSSLSHLSVPDDFSECELESALSNKTVSDVNFCTEDLSPDLYLDPNDICCVRKHEVTTPGVEFFEVLEKEFPIEPRIQLESAMQSHHIKNKDEHDSSQSINGGKVTIVNGSSEPPTAITGILHLTPLSTSSNNQIILSVSIPQSSNMTKTEMQQESKEFTVRDTPFSHAEEYILYPKYTVQSIPKDCRSIEDRVVYSPNKKRNIGLEKTNGKAISHSKKYRHVSDKKTIKLSYSSSETLPDANDFLKEVHIRIPSSSRGNCDDIASANLLSLPQETVCKQLALDASTQTSPLRSPACCSPSYSFTWLGDCRCDNYSLEPCVSAVGLSTPEDELDGLHYTKAVWSDDGSVSTSPPETPISPMREDSPLSLSASLDYIEQNAESGIGTVSTRPSISPPTNFSSIEFSGSNLSSEDTGLEASFEKRSRRYQPNSRGIRSSNHSLQYRKKRYRLRLTEQWNGREHQMTQTEMNILRPDSEHSSNYNRNLRASSEEARTLSSPKREKYVRQTISEPRLSMKSNHAYAKGGFSDASLPPLPSPKSAGNRMLPTVSENIKKIKPISRPTNLSLIPYAYPNIKASSSPAIEVRLRKRYVRSNSSASPPNVSFGATGRLPGRTQSAKELSELEAVEACKWLRAAGFPQYAQLYEDFQFPLDLLSVERDHSFLDRDSIHALFRRLKILNRCARIRLDSTKKSKIADSDEDQECALSGNWEFQAGSRRWSRVYQSQIIISGTQEDQKSNDYERKRGTSESPEDFTFGQFKRSGSERLRDGAKAILRRMESLKSKKKRKHREGITISSPTVLDDINMQARMEELGCVDITPDTSPRIHSREGGFAKNKKHLGGTNNGIGGEDSSSMASDYSQNSTPISRSRRRRKICSDRRRLGENSGAYSDSECSPPSWRREYNHSFNSVRPISSKRTVQTTPVKISGSKRRSELRHASSLTYGEESQRARENFICSLRVKPKMQEGDLPTVSSTNARQSFYDNVPLVICNKSYYDYHNNAPDIEMNTQEGSASSECTLESRESPFPSTQEDEDTDDRLSRRNTIDRWHSFNKKAPPYTTFRQFSTYIHGFSVGQMNHLRKRALLKLTALMERYCPVNRTAWNWELPKFMRKMKTPDYKDRLIFGLPLQTINQRTGQPLHPVILRAFNYMRDNCLDQVGIFRKPGVRTRIQRLRELHELGEEIDYDSYCPCDIADMIKMYFRELPEVLLTNKLSEIFITICQYLPEETRVEALQCAMLMMPDENRETLMALLSFLSDVAEQSHLNQMTANNLAVCMAPSLFHLIIGGAGSSPLRKRATGAPEQKDLHDNKAAHQCLSLMIVQVTKLMSIPIEMLSNCRFSYLDNSRPVALEDLGTNYSNGLQYNAGDWSSYMTACISSLLKETREKSRGWVNVNSQDPLVEISYRKVGDGHPLRLLRVNTEVEAPPSELITRIVRERHLWDESLLKWRVVSKLSKHAEVFQYICSSMTQRPPIDYCVLRCWKTDVGNRVCVFVETSIEHAECPLIDGCLRGIVLASRYLIQPCGSGKSRITHLSRIDMRGRLPEWYNKVYPFIAALRLAKLRDSFCHTTSGPESNV